MDDVDDSILQRVPLAQAALIVLAHATREPFLDDLYDRNRGVEQLEQFAAFR